MQKASDSDRLLAEDKSKQNSVYKVNWYGGKGYFQSDFTDLWQVAAWRKLSWCCPRDSRYAGPVDKSRRVQDHVPIISKSVHMSHPAMLRYWWNNARRLRRRIAQGWNNIFSVLKFHLWSPNLPPSLPHNIILLSSRKNRQRVHLVCIHDAGWPVLIDATFFALQ